MAMCKFLYKKAGLALPQAKTSRMYGHSIISPILFVICRCYSNARAGEPTESGRRDLSHTLMSVCTSVCVPMIYPSRLNENNFYIYTVGVRCVNYLYILSDTTFHTSVRVNV